MVTKENNKILKNFFHVINFLYFARDSFSLLKDKKLKKTKLKQISMLEDWKVDLSKKYIKNGNYLTKDEMEKFLAMYQICSIVYDTNFRQLIGGKEFHLQFDYTEVKKINKKNKLVRVKEKKINMKISQILPYIKKIK